MAEYWQGLTQVVKAGADVKQRKTKGAIRGLGLAGANTLNVSNSHVPHEEGDLERDGGWSIDNAKLLLAISYGRSADTAKYAVPQHERMDYAHDAGRNAKFLENALNSQKTQNLAIIGAQVKREIGA